MARRKALLILSQHPDVLEVAHEMDAFKKREKERLAFLKRQVEAEEKKSKDEKDVIWRKIEVLLKVKKLIPESLDCSKVGLTMSRDRDVLEMDIDEHEECDCPLCQLKRKLNLP